MTIAQWSTTAASNASGVTNVNWAEGQAPSTINDSARNMMADVATWLGQASGAIPEYLTGVAGTNTVTAGGPAQMASYVAGQRFHFIPANTNTGATTMNITPSGGSALTAKNVFFDGRACVGGELVQNVPAIIVYDGTQFNIETPAYTSRLTADSTPDATADYVTTYDASASGYKKALLKDAASPTLGTAVATTSGTTASFTGLPSGLKHIAFMLKDVSTNGTSTLELQLSTGTTFATSGYEGGSVASGGSSTAAGGAGLPLTVNALAANTYKGTAILTRENGNTWSYIANILAESGVNTISDMYTCAGWVTLGGVLDGIRLTSTSGDTFDNGEVNIQYG